MLHERSLAMCNIEKLGMSLALWFSHMYMHAYVTSLVPRPIPSFSMLHEASRFSCNMQHWKAGNGPCWGWGYTLQVAGRRISIKALHRHKVAMMSSSWIHNCMIITIYYCRASELVGIVVLIRQWDPMRSCTMWKTNDNRMLKLLT